VLAYEIRVLADRVRYSFSLKKKMLTWSYVVLFEILCFG
jgi:hypothetical protein